MPIEVGDRIDWSSPAFPRVGKVTEVVNGVAVITWGDGRTTRLPANVIERMQRKPAAG